MSFPRYPKYKPSGVEWLGEVPEHWDVTRLKGLCRLVTEKADTRNRAVALEHIESGTGRLTGDSGEFEGEGTAFVRGDLLFGKLRPYLAKAWVAEFNGEAVGDFHVMRPARELSQRYLLYTTLNRDFIQLVDGSTYGSKMPRASWDFVGCMPVCEPSLVEQRVIAAFLDRETAKIDALIAEQEKLIELLAEKRQAVISHAVTKGLNPAAPMKPSGVEWLGDVPAHWDVVRLENVGSFVWGKAHEPFVSVDGPHVCATFAYQLDRHRRLLAEDDGANQTHLCVHDFTKLKVLVPSAQEQAQIAGMLQVQDELSVGLIREAGSAVEFLRERRAALISAAVTGQIDVRNAGPENAA
ncbi:MAG: hypothetical protein NTV21_19570 [Planctomycetota bacterium]|nr:hypothetical protein [Planctomycetota bacterium]